MPIARDWLIVWIILWLTSSIAGGQDCDIELRGALGAAPSDVVCHRGYAFVSTASGVQIFDMSAFGSPVQMGIIPIFNASKLEVAGDLLVVARHNWSHSLQVAQIADPLAPVVLGSVEIDPACLQSDEHQLTASGEVAVAVARDGNAYVVDISDPHQPGIVATIESPTGSSIGLPQLIGDTLVLFLNGNQMAIYDLAEPASPALLAIRSGFSAYGSVVRGNLMFILQGMGVAVLDFSNPSDPTQISYTPVSDARRMAIDGNYLFITTQIGMSLIRVDVTDPAQPIVIGSCCQLATPPFGYVSVAAADSRVFMANGAVSRILDVTDIQSPIEVGVDSRLFLPDGLAVAGIDIVVSSPGSVDIYRLSESAGFVRIGTAPISPSTYNSIEIRLDAGFGHAVVSRRVSFGAPHVYVVDILDPTAPSTLGELSLPPSAETVVDVAVFGETAFASIQASGTATLLAYDLSSPTLALAATGPGGPFAISEGVLYQLRAVSGGETVLRALDAEDPFHGEPLATSEELPHTPSGWAQVVIEGERAYVLSNVGDQIAVLDLSAFPEIDLLGIAATPQELQINGRAAFVAHDDIIYLTYFELPFGTYEGIRRWLVAIDLSDPKRPIQLSRRPIPGAWFTIAALANDRLVMTDGGLLAFDPVTCRCPGDINGDGVVSFEDLNLMLEVFNTETGSSHPADLDGNHQVDFADLNILLGVYNSTCSDR